MIQKEKDVKYKSWILSLVLVIIISLVLLVNSYVWTLICLIGGIISIILIYFDVRYINNPNLATPTKTIIFKYIFRYIIYIIYMVILFFMCSPYEVIPAAIGLSIPRICIIIYSLIKGGERI